MSPSEFYFCIHDGNNSYHEDPKWTLITFCPKEYWAKHQCLPDYYFADTIEDSILPKGYYWYIGCEETIWCTKDSKEEIKEKLSKLGFTESKELEEFLTSCW